MKKSKNKEGIRKAMGDEYLPLVQTFCFNMGKQLQRLIACDGRLDKLYEIAKHKEDISELYLNCVTVQLQNLIDRCQGALDAIKDKPKKLA